MTQTRVGVCECGHSAFAHQHGHCAYRMCGCNGYVPRSDWLNAEMICAVCSKEWVATYPAEARALECPDCKHMNATPSGAA